VCAIGKDATAREHLFDLNAKEGAMRSTRARMLLENLESRALLTTSVGFVIPFPQVVSDKVGTVDVSFQVFSDNASAPTPETVTLTTNGLSAVPGVDYTPVHQTIALTPNSSSTVSIPILPGDASLGTRTLQVSLAPTSGAIQGASQLIVITHGTDTAPPIVVQSQALTDRGKVVAFSLQFSKPMAIGPVTNVANYGSAAPRSLKEVVGAALNYSASSAYTKNIPLKSAIYDAATNTVYLLPVNKVTPSRIRSPYPFQVVSPNPTIAAGVSTLTDTSGNPVTSGDPISLVGIAGRFAATPRLAKASPSILTYLFGTPAPGAPKAKPTHKAKSV
jgi:hypothetical protein